MSEQLDADLASLATELDQLGRNDLRTRVDAARVRLGRPSTVVCIVGEFKQGKSSLVNGLIGRDVCPVDDDIATAAVTLVRYGEQPGAIVRYRGDVEPAAERIEIERVPHYVTDLHGATDGPTVDRVDISVPSSILADGLSIVDTPGMGGLGAGHAASTLSFLPFADGLVFVTDATSELTAPELAFLERARSLCPNVLVVVTKTDVAPAWRRIMELDQMHLAARGVDVPLVAVSSTLRAAAFAARDRTLNERSGFPALIDELSTRVIDPARAGAADRARSEAIGLIDSVISGLTTEQAALADPEAHQRLVVAAREASERLDALRSGSARWNTVLGDRVSDLSSEINHRFRGSIREISRHIDSQIEELKTAEEWDDMSRELQTAIADVVTSAFVAAEDGRQSIRTEIAEMLSADDVISPTSGRREEMLDVSSFWRAHGLESGSKGGQAFKTGLTGLRGAQSGVMLFGMTGQFLPSAAALFVATNPVLLGAGVLFGGMQLVEDRKRRVQQRRQAARGQMRQFSDDVQFEMSNELTKALRDVQRNLRDEFVDLINELKTTWTSAAKQAETAMSQGEEATDRRRAALEQHHERLARLRTRIGATS